MECAACTSPLRNGYFCEHCLAPARGVDPELVEEARARDLGAESHLGAVGLWFQIDAVLLGLIALLTLQSMWFDGKRLRWEYGGEDATGTFGAILLGMVGWSVGWFLVGLFLRRFSEGARVAALISYGLGLVGLIVGYAGANWTYVQVSTGQVLAAIVGGAFQLAVLALLFSARGTRICSPTYRASMTRTPRMRAPVMRSPFFVLFAAATAMGVPFAFFLARSVLDRPLPY
jgi:hypothetical protein